MSAVKKKTTEVDIVKYKKAANKLQEQQLKIGRIRRRIEKMQQDIELEHAELREVWEE